MKLIKSLLLLVLFAAPIVAQEQITASQLPDAATNKGKVYRVTDALNYGQCTPGGGTRRISCISDGINWVPVSTPLTASDLGLSTVATSGAYSDLTGKPTIPAAQVQSDWNAGSGLGQILNKPTISGANTGDQDINHYTSSKTDWQRVFLAQVSTTDATITTIYLSPVIADGTSVHVRGVITGQYPAALGNAAVTFETEFQKVAGIVLTQTQPVRLQFDGTLGSAIATVDCVADTVNVKIKITVRGKLLTNLKWSGWAEITRESI